MYTSTNHPFGFPSFLHHESLLEDWAFISFYHRRPCSFKRAGTLNPIFSLTKFLTILQPLLLSLFLRGRCFFFFQIVFKPESLKYGISPTTLSLGFVWLWDALASPMPQNPSLCSSLCIPSSHLPRFLPQLTIQNSSCPVGQEQSTQSMWMRP